MDPRRSSKAAGLAAGACCPACRCRPSFARDAAHAARPDRRRLPPARFVEQGLDPALRGARGRVRVRIALDADPVGDRARRERPAPRAGGRGWKPPISARSAGIRRRVCTSRDRQERLRDRALARVASGAGAPTRVAAPDLARRYEPMAVASSSPTRSRTRSWPACPGNALAALARSTGSPGDRAPRRARSPWWRWASGSRRRRSGRRRSGPPATPAAPARAMPVRSTWRSSTTRSSRTIPRSPGSTSRRRPVAGVDVERRPRPGGGEPGDQPRRGGLRASASPTTRTARVSRPGVDSVLDAEPHDANAYAWALGVAQRRPVRRTSCPAPLTRPR